MLTEDNRKCKCVRNLKNEEESKAFTAITILPLSVWEEGRKRLKTAAAEPI